MEESLSAVTDLLSFFVDLLVLDISHRVDP